MVNYVNSEMEPVDNHWFLVEDLEALDHNGKSAYCGCFDITLNKVKGYYIKDHPSIKLTEEKKDLTRKFYEHINNFRPCKTRLQSLSCQVEECVFYLSFLIKKICDSLEKKELQVTEGERYFLSLCLYVYDNIDAYIDEAHLKLYETDSKDLEKGKLKLAELLDFSSIFLLCKNISILLNLEEFELIKKSLMLMK